MGFGKTINEVQEVPRSCLISDSATVFTFAVCHLIFGLIFHSFDELLELSQRGDNRTIDMLVGDIYGGMDYSKVRYSGIQCYLNEDIFFLTNGKPTFFYLMSSPNFCLSFCIMWLSSHDVEISYRSASQHQQLLQVLAKPFQKTRSLKITDLKIFLCLSCV